MNRGKKKDKEPTAVESNPDFEVKTYNTMGPFGMFESETQKVQRVEHYLKHDIDNFYRTKLSEK